MEISSCSGLGSQLFVLDSDLTVPPSLLHHCLNFFVPWCSLYAFCITFLHTSCLFSNPISLIVGHRSIYSWMSLFPFRFDLFCSVCVSIWAWIYHQLSVISSFLFWVFVFHYIPIFSFCDPLIGYVAPNSGWMAVPAPGRSGNGPLERSWRSSRLEPSCKLQKLVVVHGCCFHVYNLEKHMNNTFWHLDFAFCITQWTSAPRSRTMYRYPGETGESRSVTHTLETSTCTS